MNDQLTIREVEVLSLLAGGYSNDVIAEKLGVAPSTIKRHVQTICWKLRASNRTHAVAIAITTGLLPERPAGFDAAFDTPLGGDAV